MQLNTVIFDMDGLLIDSEPLWNEAASEILARHGITLTPQQYATTTGTRTKEFVNYWFTYFEKNVDNAGDIEHDIVEKVIELVLKKGKPMPAWLTFLIFLLIENLKLDWHLLPQ
ncbi:MAG: HAD hydrolase-like protein [Ferruginibacter sp.]